MSKSDNMTDETREQIKRDCRWLQRYPNGEWTIVGIHKRWAGWDEYSYNLCLFGFECRIWFKREIKN